MTTWEHVKISIFGVIGLVAGVSGFVMDWTGRDSGNQFAVLWICLGLVAWTRVEALERRVEELEEEEPVGK